MIEFLLFTIIGFFATFGMHGMYNDVYNKKKKVIMDDDDLVKYGKPANYRVTQIYDSNRNHISSNTANNNVLKPYRKNY